MDRNKLSVEILLLSDRRLHMDFGFCTLRNKDGHNFSRFASIPLEVNMNP